MRILVADDHNLVREALRPFLYEICGDVTILDASTFEEALETAGNTPDLKLVLLDLKMPGMDGLRGLELMRQRCPDVPVVILSGYVSRDNVMTAMRAGAAGYIPKTISGASMVNALRLVLSGERYLPSSILVGDGAGGPDDEDGANGTGTTVLDSLSNREREILALLIEGKTNKEIARQLNLQEITIKIHLRNVYRKIGAGNRAQAVRIALSAGWK